MNAKIKLLIAFSSSLMLSSPALSQVNEAVNNNIEESCAKISTLNPNVFAQQLKAFNDVLGKNPIEWSEKDYKNLYANIESCAVYNATYNKNTQYPAIALQDWLYTINNAMATILPIADHNMRIRDAYKEIWHANTFNCNVILKWKRDPIWFNDNSESLFNVSIAGMTPTQRSVLSGYIKECSPVLQKVMSSIGINSSDSEKVVGDIQKSIERENNVTKEMNLNIAPSLLVYHDNKRIPMAYLGDSSKQWVKFANDFEVLGTTMRIEDMTSLSRWADSVFKSKINKTTPETLYAEAVREIVARRMFKK